VAKLAVRANRQGRITIGLFRQKSHDVLDATNCPAHHPSINRAVQGLQDICRRSNPEHDNHSRRHQDHGNSNVVVDLDGTRAIPAYSEQSGKGCFRYVQCQVERATGAVQITLVWRKDPQYDAALKYLCQEIVVASASSSIASCASSTSPGVAAKHNYSNGRVCYDGEGGFLLHSLWVHYNNAGKHENSIVSRSASVSTMECNSLDELHNLGQDGSWVHITTTTTGASTRDDTKDVNGTILLPGVVVERLDNVILKPRDNGNDHDHDDDHNRRKPQLLSVPLHFAPNVFRQANLDGFAAIVAKIRSYFQAHLEQQQQRPQPCINLVELYGGVGTIGLHLADLCTSLVCSDENPYNHSCFQAAVNGMQWSSQASSSSSSKMKKKKYKKHRKNIKEEDSKDGSSGAAPSAMIRYEPISATAMVQDVELFRDADWIVIDPPRKGLDEAVIQALCRDHGLHHRESRAQQQTQKQQVLVYVSCGFDAFQRDFGQLTTMGKPWKLQHAEGHILFPGSDAIEVLAFFTR
jgi:tRNA/tmRNA/rRNA uracil-C5-methylase (TrmA/RlmC/RlmD family)